ncbi:MAG: formylglycine-generating enzyme family protein [Rubripirellula sp.]
MAAARFMKELEAPIVEGHNFATIDLFDRDHAERVLIKFGQAFGKLPDDSQPLSEQQSSFVKSVASGLAEQEGKTVSIRLSLFAEMIKSKPWVPHTLDQVGGTAGIGVNFLSQYGEFGEQTGNVVRSEKKATAFETCPQMNLTWFQAARHYRWLSEQEGIFENQVCYPPIAEIKAGMELPADAFQRTGYRLPTEAEWEFACRAGTTTPHYFGNDSSLLALHGHSVETAKDRPSPVAMLRPNDFGLFDMLGNAMEWCHDPYVEIYGDRPTDGEQMPVVNDQHRVIRSGSYWTKESYLRSAKRFRNQPHKTRTDYGFRVARTHAP